MTRRSVPEINSYVGKSLMNQQMARVFISKHIDTVVLKLPRHVANTFRLSRVQVIMSGPDRGLIQTQALGWIVDAFMRAYPRGQGTKGNELFREFYAACYSIKKYQSVPNIVTSNIHHAGDRPVQPEYLTSAQQVALLQFDNRTFHLINPNIPARMIQSLYARELVTSLHSHNKVAEAWLTDKGVATLKLLIPHRELPAVKKNIEARDLLTQMLRHHEEVLASSGGDAIMHQRAVAYLKDQIK